MSKAVRWQVPFVSVSGTKYRVDIYDETGSWSGVTQLLAGDQPFVTDEDASDDYFAPVRSQSGTLQVCTKIEPQTTYPSGGTLSLNDILPANNIAHPVRLVRVTPIGNPIQWAGFLSAETYNQDYTGVPQNISLSLISILEAMDSVKVNPLYFTGVMAGHTILYYTLRMIEMEVGMTIVQNVAYSYAAWEILSKYFDTGLFFDNKAYINESTTTYTSVGISCKELLERICKFMGWTARERSLTIYLQRLTEEVGMYKQSLTSLNFDTWSASAVRDTVLLQPKSIATDIEWRGTGHQISVEQGAKSVEVVANVKNFDADMGLPDFPGSNPTSAYTKEVQDYNGGNPRSLYIQNILEQNLYANNITQFGYSKYKFYQGENGFVAEYQGGATPAEFIANGFLRTAGGFSYLDSDPTKYIHYAGAAYIRYAVMETQSGTPASYEQGMYCGFMPGLYGTAVSPIFTLRNPNPVSLYAGTLKVNITMYFLGICATSYSSSNWLSYACFSNSLNSPMNLELSGSMAINVGQWWWNGSAWTTTPTSFRVTLKDSGITAEIPVSANIFGEMKVYMYPGITCPSGSGWTNNMSVLYETIIKSMDVTFTPNSTISQMDRSENKYMTILSTNFRDEISISTDLATYNNNIDSPSLVIANSAVVGQNRYVQKINYHIAQHVFSIRRPEIDLLNRLAAYYGASRQRLELDGNIKNTSMSVVPTPIVKLTGLGDGKTYLPLSESRDWQADVDKITCFEMPV